MIICPACNHNIDDSADKCKRCGCPVEIFTSKDDYSDYIKSVVTPYRKQYYTTQINSEIKKEKTNKHNFILDGKVLKQYIGHDRIVAIPAGTVIVNQEAFVNALELECLFIPKSVQIFGAVTGVGNRIPGMFHSQNGVRYILFEKDSALNTIGFAVFFNLGKHNDIYFDNFPLKSISEIHESAFFNFSNYEVLCEVDLEITKRKSLKAHADWRN